VLSFALTAMQVKTYKYMLGFNCIFTFFKILKYLRLEASLRHCHYALQEWVLWKRDDSYRTDPAPALSYCHHFLVQPHTHVCSSGEYSQRLP
jgi:hypothetical protein